MSTSVSTVSTGTAQSVSTVGTANASSGATTLTLDEMISSKVQPYLDLADNVATEISENSTKITYYQSMQTLLTSLQSASSNLTSEALEGSNVFYKRTASLASSSVVSGGSPSDASALMSVSVADNTATGTHTVIVNQIAQAETDISAYLTHASGSSYTVSSGGTITIGEAGMTATDITVTAGESLDDIVSAINNVSDQTGVTASVVAVSSTQSVLVLTGADTNKTLTLTDTSGTVLSDLGVIKSEDQSNAASTATSALGVSGTFKLTSSGATVTVSSTDTLTDVMNAINTAYGAGTATIDSNNRLTLSSSGSWSLTDVSGSVLSSLGFGNTNNEAQAAQAAILTVDGVSGITRDSNEISDIISGVTLNLKGADANTKVSVTIGADTTSAASAIQSFVTAYNNWQSFVTAMNATNSDGTAASTAVLFGDSSLRTASMSLSSEIASTALGIADVTNAVNLAAIGISINSSNQLEINSTTLTSALTDNYDEVAALFTNTVSVDTSGASGTTFKASGTNYSTYAGSLTFTYSNGAVTVTNSSGTDVTSSFTVSGTTITGNSSTDYSGLNFTFSGDISGSGTLGKATMTEGLANQVYATSKNFGNTSTGSVQSIIGGLKTDNIALNSEYTNLLNEAQDYTDFLTNQYATLSAQIAAYNQTLVTLKALIAAGNSSSS